jgi:prepilin-type N-terminal cleavage/methylation domain-containing protein
MICTIPHVFAAATPRRGAIVCSMRGHSLVELLLALAVVGILAGLAIPRVRHVADSLAVEQAAQRIVAMHQRARISAVLESRRTLYRIGPDSLSIAVLADGDTLLRAAAAGPAADGVALSGPARAITWAPTGIAIGASNGTWRLTRGAARREVVIARLGRVRVVRQ